MTTKSKEYFQSRIKRDFPTVNLHYTNVGERIGREQKRLAKLAEEDKVNQVEVAAKVRTLKRKAS